MSENLERVVPAPLVHGQPREPERDDDQEDAACEPVAGAHEDEHRRKRERQHHELGPENMRAGA